MLLQQSVPTFGNPNVTKFVEKYYYFLPQIDLQQRSQTISTQNTNNLYLIIKAKGFLPDFGDSTF
jgi:hypothetical protein